MPTLFALLCPFIVQCTLIHAGNGAGERVIAVHGTSLASIEIALRTGFLQNSNEAPDTVFATGIRESLAAFPRSTGIRSDHLIPATEARETGEGYARSQSVASYILQQTGIPWSEGRQPIIELPSPAVFTDPAVRARRQRMFAGVEDVVDGFLAEERKALKFFEERGVSKERLTQLMGESEPQKGVLVYISESALQDIQVKRGPEGELQLKSAKGLALKHIVGIVPLGEPERLALEKLRASGRFPRPEVLDFDCDRAFSSFA